MVPRLVSKQRPRPSADRSTPDLGTSIISYLIGGLAFYGGLGWLLDHATGHSALFLPIGLVVGIAASLYLIYIRFGR
jgi:ATP synthase protein I